MPITTQSSKHFYDTLSELFKLHFDRFNDRLEREVGGLRSEMEQRIAAAEVQVIRWMFVFWVGSIGTMIALTKF